MFFCHLNLKWIKGIIFAIQLVKHCFYNYASLKYSMYLVSYHYCFIMYRCMCLIMSGFIPVYSIVWSAFFVSFYAFLLNIFRERYYQLQFQLAVSDSLHDTIMKRDNRLQESIQSRYFSNSDNIIKWLLYLCLSKRVKKQKNEWYSYYRLNELQNVHDQM